MADSKPLVRFVFYLNAEEDAALIAALQSALRRRRLSGYIRALLEADLRKRNNAKETTTPAAHPRHDDRGD